MSGTKKSRKKQKGADGKACWEGNEGTNQEMRCEVENMIGISEKHYKKNYKYQFDSLFFFEMSNKYADIASG